MLPTPWLFTLNLLAQTVFADAAQSDADEALACDSGLASSDDPLGSINAQDRVQIPDSHDHFKLQGMPGDRVQASSHPKDHARPRASPENHAQTPVHPEKKVHSEIRVQGQPAPLRPTQSPAHVHSHVHSHGHSHSHSHGHEKSAANHHLTGTRVGSSIAGQHTPGINSNHPSTSAASAIPPVKSSAVPSPGETSASSTDVSVPTRYTASLPQGDRRGFMNGLYFTNWNVKEAYFDPENIKAKRITHAIYAFAKIHPNGTVGSFDPWADVEKPWSTDTGVRGDDAWGCVKRMFILKKSNRNLKTLLSIGGWTASQEGGFSTMAATEEGRKRFAKTAVRLATDWGMDGLDIDWEYPANAAQASDLVSLLKECREAFDDYAAKLGQRYHYLLSAATPAGPNQYGNMDLVGMDKYLDIWNIMAYDFAGTWETTTGHQANVFQDAVSPVNTKFSSNRAVNDYRNAKIHPSKINLGIPLYGRSFAKTKGLGSAFQGSDPECKEGTWPYRELPRPGAKVEYDPEIMASWSYDERSRELVSFDNAQSVRDKARYIMEKDLGGAFFWEASGDKVGDESLVGTMAASLKSLDESENMLDYPQSQYENIGNCMDDAQDRRNNPRHRRRGV